MSTRTSVVFIHGLWMHAESWRPWVELFRSLGYDAIAPGWPGDSSTVAETRKHPELLANRGLEEITEHYARLVRALDDKPVVIGHSLGGLIAQKLLGVGLATAAVAIAPVQMRGVLPLPIVQMKNALPVLRNPANYLRAVAQTREQFHRGFASEVSAQESDALHARYAIPAPGRPLFEAAFANLNVRTAARVNVQSSDRGPLLVIGAGKDATVPEIIARAVHRLYKNARTLNEYTVFPDRGHSLVIDARWNDVASATLDWLERQGLPGERIERAA